MADRVLLIPVTSRSLEQYERIYWPERSTPALAITTHGAKLFTHGLEDGQWKKETQCLVAPWREEMKHFETYFASDPSFIRCRLVDDSYLFVYCAENTDPYAAGEKLHEMTRLSVQVSGKKIYLLPPGLNKGMAIMRLRQHYPQYRIIAAGDSEMDLDMLNAADDALFPEKIASRVSTVGCCCPESELFSEFVVTQLLNKIRS